MEQPLVSVVIPVWNGERYLRAAIDSILAQDFEAFELIVIDDGSTDGTAAILAGYAADSRIRTIRQPNAGVVAARNAGLAAARAELVAFLDADDIARPDRLAKQFVYMTMHADVAVLGSAIACHDEAGRPLRIHKFPTEPTDIAQELAHGNAIAQPSVMLRRSVALAIGGYRKAFKLGAEDYDLWLRLSEKHPLANLGEPLTLYRIQAESLTHRHRHAQTLAAMAARIAYRRRKAGRPDPLEGLDRPFAPEDLGMLGLSEDEECLFMPCLFGLLTKEGADAESTERLLRRAWDLRDHLPRGRLVRHCLAPGIRLLLGNRERSAAAKWALKAFVTEPFSSCWMTLRMLSSKQG